MGDREIARGARAAQKSPRPFPAQFSNSRDFIPLRTKGLIELGPHEIDLLLKLRTVTYAQLQNDRRRALAADLGGLGRFDEAAALLKGIEGLDEDIARLRQEADACPLKLHELVTPVPEGFSVRAFRDSAARSFARTRTCCLTPEFTAPLHKPFVDAVGTAGTHRVDFSGLVDELDVIVNWLKCTRAATTIGEKLHKLHWDLSKARGRKPHNAIRTIMGALLAQLRQLWESSGFQMRHRMDHPAVKALIETGKRIARYAPSSSSSKRATSA